jgi:hypothetical protein
MNDTFCPHCKRVVIVTPFVDRVLILSGGIRVPVIVFTIYCHCFKHDIITEMEETS